jgi:hypothetical protein
MNPTDIEQTFKCPLCGSVLARDVWVKITGQWDQFEKERTEGKKLLEKYKKEKEELEKKHKIDVAKSAKLAEAAGMEKGIKKEKGERDRMSKMLQNQTKTIIASDKKIQELQKQLKEGKTPQTAGFEYEKEVQKMLSETFPEDTIQPTGKMGDVIQLVFFEGRAVGSILYECKKTEKYSNQFIKEIKQHQETARTDYAVIVTHAPKEGKSKFFIEGGVVVIDPVGLLDVAFLLRNFVIDVHKMKLTKEKTKEKGIQILRYMQSGEFRNKMVDTIEKSKRAQELLRKESEEHQSMWRERDKIYNSIHENTQNVRGAIGEIITGKPVEIEKHTPTTVELTKIPVFKKIEPAEQKIEPFR